MSNLRKMPDAIQLGQHMLSTVGHLEHASNGKVPDGARSVFGLWLPTWQRPFVWTKEQSIKFVESIWLAIPVGTYTYVCDIGGPFDGCLIDGQQRLTSLQMYFNNEFPVFGYFYNEITEVDERMLSMSRSFPCFRVSGKEARNESYLRNYYDLMNFGGTAHTKEQRAT